MFVKEKLVRFHHCDPAGIVFYPQYFVLFHELMEDWFNEGLGHNYAEFVKLQGMGLPMVKLDCEFVAPNSMGDMLALALAVKRIGTSSLVLSVRGTAHGKECVRATLTVVHSSIKEMRSAPIPDALRSAIELFMERP